MVSGFDSTGLESDDRLVVDGEKEDGIKVSRLGNWIRMTHNWHQE